jgi:hypothetical protein
MPKVLTASIAFVAGPRKRRLVCTTRHCRQSCCCFCCCRDCHGIADKTLSNRPRLWDIVLRTKRSISFSKDAVPSSRIVTTASGIQSYSVARLHIAAEKIVRKIQQKGSVSSLVESTAPLNEGDADASSLPTRDAWNAAREETAFQDSRPWPIRG